MSDMVQEVEEQDDAPPPQQQRKPGRLAPAAKPEGANPAAQALAHEDAKSVFDWLKSLGQAGAIRAKLTRISPATTPDGQPCKGYLTEYEEMVDEKEIMRVYGGGVFQLKVQTPNQRGGWIYAGQRQFDIGVPPKIPGYEREKDDVPIVVAPKNDGAADRAMGYMAQLTENAQKRADRVEERARNDSGGMDMATMKLLLAPLESQVLNLNQTISNLQNQISIKDKQILELSLKKPETSFQDTLIMRMTDAENTHLTRIREEHMSELRQLRQSHTDETRALREAGQRELDARERAHERELKSLRDMTTMITESGKQGTEARVDALKTTNAALERQLTVATTELASLREKKDKSLIETLGELTSTKEALDSLTGGGGNAEEPPIWERAMTTILDSPLAKAVAHRVEQAPAAPPPQQVQQVRRRVVRRDPNAPVQPMPAAAQPTDTTVVDQALAEQPTAEGQPAAAAPAAKKKPEAPKFTQVELSMAVQFMENAVNSSQTTPEAFAESIRSSVPGYIITYIRDAGIDEFLRLARLPDSSPLNSQHGKNFIRKVAKVLVGGVAEA